MSPKLRETTYISIVPERIKEVAVKKQIRMKDLAASVGTVYENFSRQIKKGQIQKDWLEIICDKLNVSREYLIGNSEKIGSRSNDFNRIDKVREALKQIVVYSRSSDLVEDVELLSDFDIHEIATEICGLIMDWDDIVEKRLLQLKEEI